MAGTRSQANSDKLLDSSKLSKEGKAIVQLITGHIDILREEFGDIFRENDKEIFNLKLELSSLKAKMAILEERHDDADAYERRDTLLISGDGVPHVAAGENCNALVCSMVKEKLKINISPNDISTSHRTGPKPRSPQVEDKRNIIVKLCRRDLKGELLSAFRKCKPNFYINESLTPTRSAILYALRKAKRMSPGVVAGCNSENGRVYAYVKNRDAAGDVTRNKKLLINTRLKLEDFCNNVLKVPVSSLISVWPQ